MVTKPENFSRINLFEFAETQPCGKFLELLRKTAQAYEELRKTALSSPNHTNRNVPEKIGKLAVELIKQLKPFAESEKEKEISAELGARAQRAEKILEKRNHPFYKPEPAEDLSLFDDNGALYNIFQNPETPSSNLLEECIKRLEPEKSP